MKEIWTDGMEESNGGNKDGGHRRKNKQSILNSHVENNVPSCSVVNLNGVQMAPYSLTVQIRGRRYPYSKLG